MIDRPKRAYTELNTCLACGDQRLFKYLDLGTQPLANSYHPGTVPLPEYPLAVQACRSCFHSQLTVAVDPALMFDDYLYVSGTSKTLRNYMADFAARFPKGIRVLDIASNDGTLLKAFADRDCVAVGVEPCHALARAPDQPPVWAHYWDAPLARLIVKEHGKFDVIVAMNVLGHTADPLTFLTLARDALAPGGTIWVQTSQSNMVLDGCFDAIYHEHVSYFTPRSLAALAYRAGLHAVSFEMPSIHGGSMLVALAVGAEPQGTTHSPLYEEASYAKFRGNVERDIARYRATGFSGSPVIGYGAAAKGMTFLNATGIRMDAIVDDNPAKWGLLTPGRNIPIRSPDDLKPPGKGIVVVLAWNFWEEIVSRIRDQHGSGHTVMRFLPSPQSVMT